MIQTAPYIEPKEQIEETQKVSLILDIVTPDKVKACSLCENLKEKSGIPTCISLNEPIHIVLKYHNCPLGRWNL